MNHLAHVHLSFNDVQILAGNLSADFLTKPQSLELPIELQIGVALHRHIDHTTDHHPCVKRAWALLREHHGKYASVIYDIYCDFLLSKHWKEFDIRPLQIVAQNAYRAIQSERDHLPEALNDRFERMIAADWLVHYQTYDEMTYVFERFSKRLSKPELLHGVIQTLQADEAFYSEMFIEFYTELQQSCAKFLRTYPQSVQ